MLPKKGIVLPNRNHAESAELSYAAAVAAALRADLGVTHQATKTVMQWTGAGERTVKNWLGGHSGPSGQHLVSLLRHSDPVLEALLRLAGRTPAIAATRLVEVREKLRELLQFADLLADGGR